MHNPDSWIGIMDTLKKVRMKINGFNSRCLHAITDKSHRERETYPIYNLVADIRCRRLHYREQLLRTRIDTSRLVKCTLLAYILW